MASGRIAIGVDVGGSGIKAAVVDVESGRLRSLRHRVPTPNPSTPEAVLASINRMVKRLAKETGLGDATPIGWIALQMSWAKPGSVSASVRQPPPADA